MQQVELEVRIVALDGREVAVAGGTRMTFSRPRGQFDFLIVPGMETMRDADWSARLAALQPEAAYLRDAFKRGTQIASVCVGAFLVGEAGLLDGRKATTSWLFAAALAQRFPDTEVDASAVLLEDDGVTTTAAVSSVFDLALHLAKRFYGAAAAAATARIALLHNTRNSQTPYVDSAMLPDRRASFSASAQRLVRAAPVGALRFGRRGRRLPCESAHADAAREGGNRPVSADAVAARARGPGQAPAAANEMEHRPRHRGGRL